MRYFSWRPFRKNGNLGKWAKTHIIKDERTLCGLKVPRKLDVFDYSSEGFAGDGCKKCWSKRPLAQKQKEITMTKRMNEYAEYIKDRWDYISKTDLLVDDKEMRIAHGLTVEEAIRVWRKVYER